MTGLSSFKRLCLLIAACCALPAQAETISFAVAEWPPYFTKEPPHGYHAIALKKLFATEDIDVKFMWYHDWKATLSTTYAGRHHATPSWLCTPEYIEQFRVSEPIFETHIVLMHLTDETINWNTLDDLRFLGPIGVTKSYTYNLALQQTIQKYEIPLHIVRKDELLTKLLLAKRIKVAVVNRLNGLSLIEKLPENNRKKLTLHPKPLSNAILHILISKNIPDSKQLTNKINELIKVQKNILQPDITSKSLSDSCSFIKNK